MKRENKTIPFTQRELQIIQYAAEGLSNREISETLSLSQHTIKHELSSVFEKCGARNRAHAVYMLTLKGYIKY